MFTFPLRRSSYPSDSTGYRGGFEALSFLLLYESQYPTSLSDSAAYAGYLALHRPGPPEFILVQAAAVARRQLGDIAGAAHLLVLATQGSNSETACRWAAEFLLAVGRPDQAQSLLQQASHVSRENGTRPLAGQEDCRPGYVGSPTPILCIPDLAGEHYISVLRHVHEALKPRSYLEIGTHRGASLSLATCPSIAIDPNLQFLDGGALSNKSTCAVFEMESDKFYESESPTAILGRRIDLAFLDGLHHCEALLRDFKNTEAYCYNKSVIILHDCLPVEDTLAHRVPGVAPRASHRRKWWTGDVWRTAVILKRYRKDLRILAVAAPPSGLVLITSLNPTGGFNCIPYPFLVEQMMRLELGAIGIDGVFRELEVKPTNILNSAASIVRHFS